MLMVRCIGNENLLIIYYSLKRIILESPGLMWSWDKISVLCLKSCQEVEIAEAQETAL